MATGVLPLLTGRATRLAQFFIRNDKHYEATIRFGYSTDTYDAEGTPTSQAKDITLDCGAVREVLSSFTGRIMQVPPKFSAKKIAGKPAYKLARADAEVELAAVEVEIYSIHMTRCEQSEIDLHIHCGSGTYVRSIAHDLGVRFGCGAFLSRLRRVASGVFDLDNVRTVDELQRLSDNGLLSDALIPASKLLPEMPVETVDLATIGFIRQGREFRVSPFRGLQAVRFIKAVSAEGELIAIGQAKMPNVYHPVLVL